jgi:hypothetical protein
VAKEACTLDAYGAVSGPPTQPYGPLRCSVKLGAFYEHKEAPQVLETQLKVAGGVGSSTSARREGGFRVARLRPQHCRSVCRDESAAKLTRPDLFRLLLGYPV